MPPPIRYGPWIPYSGIRESAAGLIPSWLPDKYLFSYPCGTILRHGSGFYSITEGLDTFAAGTYAYNSVDAHLCALAHAREYGSGFYSAWAPGSCPAVPSPPSDYRDLDGLSGLTNTVTIGTSATATPPSLPLVGSTYALAVYMAVWGLGWQPSTDPDAPTVSVPALVQIPGWLEAMDAGKEPQVEVLQVDAEASLQVQSVDVGPGLDVSARARPEPAFLVDYRAVTVTPYSLMGAAEMTAAGSPGATSGTLSFPDLAAGEQHHWDLASSAVAAGVDPGAGPNTATVQCRADFIWAGRIRFQGIPPLRWLNRDDGLGVTGAKRARTGTSLQSTTRHRGYR